MPFITSSFNKSSYASAPCKLTISSYLFRFRQVAPIPACLLFKTSATSRPLTLKLVSESRVTWATSVTVPILVFLGLSVLDLGPMYATDRRQTKASLSASALWGQRHIKVGRVSQVKPSNCFRRLNKLVLPSTFDTSLSSLMM